MKKILSLGIVAMVMIFAVAAAFAGVIYSRSTATLGTTTGTGSWTNTQQYSALALKRIWIKGNLDTAATVTVSRVTSDGVWTQTVGSVVCASGAGSQGTLTASFMKYGDILTFANSTATGATAMVEYEVQQ